MTRQNRAYLLAGLSTLAWATMASVFKVTLRSLAGDTVSLIAWSTAISFVSLLTAVILTGRWKAWAGQPRSGWIRSAVLGLFNPVLYYLVLLEAYNLLPGQEAGPLNYTWPIVLSLFSALFLGQKLKPVHLGALLLSFCGVLIVSTQGRVFQLAFTNLTGAVLAVGSSLFWSAYWIGNLKDPRPVLFKLTANLGFGVVYLAVFCLVTGRAPVMHGPAWGGAVWMGWFEMGFTFVMWQKALELSDRTASVSNLIYLSPFLSLVFLHFIAGETIHPASIAGLVFITGGIVMQVDKGKRAGQRKKSKDKR